MNAYSDKDQSEKNQCNAANNFVPRFDFFAFFGMCLLGAIITGAAKYIPSDSSDVAIGESIAANAKVAHSKNIMPPISAKTTVAILV